MKGSRSSVRFASRLRSPLLGAAAAALVLTATTALAGSGAGGVFNLGQVNGVDAQTSLTGNPGGNPLLKVTSTGTAAAVRGVATNGIGTNGVSTSGVGQQGLSTSGIGTLGTHGGTTGISPGVQGETSSTDPAGAGVVGKNTGGGPGLRAIVNAGAPPLAVNSSVKVANLNADLLDGLDSPAFQKRVTGTCSAGSAVKTVNADGTVTCEPVGGGGVWSLTGNSGTTPGTNFLGTTDNQALELKVNGQRALRIEPDATSPNLIGGSSANFVAPGIGGATIGGGGADGTPNAVTGGFGTVGGGWNNSAGGSATAAGGQGNAASGNYSAIGGGFANQASGSNSSAVAGGHSNQASADYSSVGGGHLNVASGAASLVGGGESNQASHPYSTVVGGKSNLANGDNSIVAGGIISQASGYASVVGGGQSNWASADYSSVAGGIANTASGDSSTVAGGDSNHATGGAATVPGGALNRADGIESFAAGFHAIALNDGSFVWGDRTFTDVVSPGGNTFTVRAGGGIWLGTTSTPVIPTGHFLETSTGGYLSTGGAWTNASDRAKKHDFRSLDKRSVLEKVAGIPITSWSYKAEKPSVRHIGPMAQDFYKAFALGLDNKHITTIDEGGVALAAIQGLYRQNQALERRVELLEHQLQIQEGRRGR